MARFYDTINDSELVRVESLLKKGGIAYTLQGAANNVELKEIQVAEEDFAAAERALSGESWRSH